MLAAIKILSPTGGLQTTANNHPIHLNESNTDVKFTDVVIKIAHHGALTFQFLAV